MTAILASALGFIDGSVVAIALPAMRADLGATLSQAQWISNAYLLTLSALILVGGAFGDRFGLARVFGGGIALFVVASVFCAAAPNAQSLIIARLVQGVGAAFMVPGSLALIARAYPDGERGAAIGTWAAASAVTTAAGPIIGGLLLTFGTDSIWRWIFAVNLPLGALALWLLIRHVDRDPNTATAGLDLPGAALATLGLGALAWALTGAEHGQSASLGLATFGIAALALFLWVEAHSPCPMLPLGLFADRAFSAANAITFTIYFALSTLLFYLPMTVISTWGVTAIEAAAAFAPLSVFIGLFSARIGRLEPRFGAGPLIATGCGLLAIAYVAIAITAPAMQFWTRTFPGCVVLGAGMALIVTPLSTTIMASVPAASTGTASGVNNAVSRLAGLIAVAAMGSLAAVVYGAYGGALSFGAADPDAAHAIATTRAFTLLCGVAAVLAGLSCIGALIYLPRAATQPQSMGGR
ncbi:MFS transporter [Actibacterium sp. 188UL27-1]|uniref:MFS transporter n=1 Tax=Actibacterium sp. 188UL27-1 TaxID=2786961 RepID=UPI001959A453|nr:MFS transporter [Actibacterium sp. 188UL27-1]